MCRYVFRTILIPMSIAAMALCGGLAAAQQPAEVPAENSVDGLAIGAVTDVDTQLADIVEAPARLLDQHSRIAHGLFGLRGRVLRREAGEEYVIGGAIVESFSMPALLMGIDKWLELLLTGPESLRQRAAESLHGPGPPGSLSRVDQFWLLQFDQERFSVTGISSIYLRGVRGSVGEEGSVAGSSKGSKRYKR